MPRLKKATDTTVVSALRARTHFGSLLRRVEQERSSVVIQKRGVPRAVLLSIQDYIRLAAPEPEILRIIGEQSMRNGTDKITMPQIDAIIQKTRTQKTKR